jgi:hypothetical protein
MSDVNGDGLLDIYLCYSGPGTDAERANELYINNRCKKWYSNIYRICKTIWFGCTRALTHNSFFF